MNLLHHEALELVQKVGNYCQQTELNKVEVIVAPTFLDLAAAAYLTKGANLSIAAQNCSEHKQGAFTGEVSLDMIKSAQVNMVIIGHSERRQFFGDTEEVVHTKLQKALSARMIPILCIGESLEDRKSGNHEKIVKQQLQSALRGRAAENLTELIIAYEPVWAIGTGETASPAQAQEMHHFIRKQLNEMYDEAMAARTSILYGGSVKPSNAAELFSQPDINGGLIGGASLKYEDFVSLIEIGKKELR